jgi:hypothetical protein
MAAEHEQTVLVWDKPHKISVYQKSRALWIAVGKHMGERLEVNGKSRGAALRKWIEAVKSSASH